ncbi:MAG: antitoxin family protein [Pyrinomonadaceae bacterium]
MSRSVQAIFQNGLLRPLSPLDLPEDSIVEIDVKDVEPQQEDKYQWLAEFDEWTQNLESGLPALSLEQISRESIYREQLDRQR